MAVKKNKTKKPEIPTLESILDSADKAYTDITRKYYVLGCTYVMAVDYYGTTGRRAFKERFPLTDNALRNLELVGRGRLLPQFSMCSNRFTSGLVNLEDSLKWQYKLIGASSVGTVRVRKGDKIVDKKFSDFLAKEEDAVLSIISKADKNLSQEELAKKLRDIRSEVRAEIKKSYGSRPKYKIEEVNGVPVVKFFRAVPYTAEELMKIVEELNSSKANNN